MKISLQIIREKFLAEAQRERERERGCLKQTINTQDVVISQSTDRKGVLSKETKRSDR